MDLAGVNSPPAAFIAGLVTSLHCAGMCGPLACSVMPARRGQGDPLVTATAYHGCRLTAYCVLGIVAGGFGRLPLSWLSQSVLRWLPWLGIVCFVGLALRWDRRWPKLPALGRLYTKIAMRIRAFPRPAAAAALGLATPLLPCGPLYFLITLALLSGSAAKGAEFMLAFGLGTIPLLWTVQTQFGRLDTHLSPRWIARIRVGLSVTAALVAAWRLRGTLGLGGADPGSFLCF
jgi:uncharacterized protein